MASPSNWVFDIFSWERLMAVFTVFAVLCSTTFVPMWHMYRKKQEDREDQVKKEHTEIMNSLIKPITDRIEQLEEEHKDMKHELRAFSRAMEDHNQRLERVKDVQTELDKKLYFLNHRDKD